jgi:hypothetical protein
MINNPFMYALLFAYKAIVAILLHTKAIPKYIKTLVWNQYVGEHRAEACCSCCRKTQINVRHFHCGHIVAEAKGDLTICTQFVPTAISQWVQ